MIRYTALTLRNFLSVGNVTQALRLDEHKLTLVLGENGDTNGAPSRNGAGKTSILQAISYVLYGQPLTKIRPDNLINNVNLKGMLVTLDFDVDGTRYRIERGRKPAVLRFFINDRTAEVRDEAQGENRHTQEAIERVIGMSHLPFKNMVILNTSTDPFLRMKAAEQRELIEELLGITQISQRADTLRKAIATTKETIKIEEATIKAIAEANTRIGVQIGKAEQASQTWETTHLQQLRELAEEIEAVTALDFEAEIAAFDAVDAWRSSRDQHTAALEISRKECALLEREASGLEAEVARLQRDASQDGTAQIARLESDTQRWRREVERKHALIKSLIAEADKLADDLDHTDGMTCMACDQALTGTAHLATVRHKLRQQMIALNSRVTNEQDETDDLRQKIADSKAEIQALQAAAAASRDSMATRLAATEEKALAARQEASRQAEAVQPLIAALAALGAAPQTTFRSREDAYQARQMRDTLLRQLAEAEAQANPHLDHLASLRDTLAEIDYTQINDLTHRLKHQDFLLKLLTSKDSFIRKRIIDQNLAYLNARMGVLLERLNLPHTVCFQNDLSVEIDLLGRSFDFEQLSRGEMNRVTMATSWAFRNLWESMNTSINLLCVDELIDQGTDAQGADAALSILQGMAHEQGKNVFLISHRDELIPRCDNILMVRKIEGFTGFEGNVSL